MMLLAQKLERELAAKDAELSGIRGVLKEYGYENETIRHTDPDRGIVDDKLTLVATVMFALDAKEAELAEARRIIEILKQDNFNLTEKVIPNIREQAEARAAAAYDLLRECLDWGLPEDLKDRIDAAIGERDDA
jgi:hypothetical protein